MTAPLRGPLGPAHLAQQLPVPDLPAPLRDTAGADTADTAGTYTPQVGRVAERILDDSLRNVPGHVAAWGREVYTDFLATLPRLGAAFLAAAVVLAVTLWLRALARRHAEPESESPHMIGVLGVLAAVIVAAALVGWTSLAAASLTFAFFYALAALVRIFGARVLRRARAAPEAIELALIVVRYALVVLGAVEALGTLGLNLTGVIAGLGILTIAVGFAAQDTFSNLISGFMILWDRSLRVGDWIRVGEAEGRVRRITLRTTRIETRDEGILVIPNKDVTGQTLYNFSLRPLSRVRVPVGINYDADVHAARAAMLALVPDAPFVAREPPPFVAVTELGESAVRMELVFFITDPRELVPVRWRVTEEILLAFRERGIEITYPQLNVHVRSIVGDGG